MMMMFTNTTYKALFSLHLILTVTSELDTIIIHILHMGTLKQKGTGIWPRSHFSEWWNQGHPTRAQMLNCSVILALSPTEQQAQFQAQAQHAEVFAELNLFLHSVYEIYAL